jgi:putative FmdB family regulatory protein
MPIYEYSCKKCGETIEVIQKFSDPVLKKHKGCGGALTKLISAAGFQFKGTGWYVTDYARKGKGGDGDSASESSKETKEKKEANAKSESASKETGKDSKKSSSKPAAAGSGKTGD